MALHHAPEEDQNSVIKEIVKHQARKAGRAVAKKLLKKGAKLAIKAVLKLGAGLVKVFLALLGSIGLPVLLILGSIVVLVIITSLVSSFLFGTGDGLTGKDKELHNYIVEQANATVNMSSDFQKRYRVPHELIAAVVQLDVMKSKSDTDLKKIVKEMAEGLKPDFQTDKFNEWKETKTQVCEDGICGEWSKPVKEDNFVEKYTSVDYWNGYTTITYTPYVTDWYKDVKITYRDETYTEVVVKDVIEYKKVAREVVVKVPYTTYVYRPYHDENGDLVCCQRVEVTRYREEVQIVYDIIPYVTQVEEEVEKTRTIEIKTTTMTRYQRFKSTKNDTEDYSKFDAFLNSYGLGMKDKKLLEINYEFIGGTINYSNWLAQFGGFYGGGNYGGFTGTIIPGAGVPAQYMEFYRGAEQKYGVDWYTLAAVHFVETGYGTHPTMVSTAGALGHMQFMPATWVGWKYNIGGGLVSPSLDITSLRVIKAGNGYGVDGCGDGKADPFDPCDAIYTAAHYLSKSGYATDPRKAIYNYNHAWWYVDKVVTKADEIKTQSVYKPIDSPEITDGYFMLPTTGPVSSGYGRRWGRMHTGVDIAKNRRPHDVPIVAAADGIVRISGYSGSSYGHWVVLKHVIDGKEFETLYAHMTGRAVKEGQKVVKGQFLGNMGDTGNSTGPHLHFEIHEGPWNSQRTNSVDPVKYLPQLEYKGN